MRFENAIDFVIQYAENISAGGLFVGHANNLEPLSVIEVTVVLPGFGAHKVKAKVAHIMEDEMAQKIGLPAGAGLELMETDSVFQNALSEYLLVLGKRKEAKVLVSDAELCGQIKNAGYDAIPYQANQESGAMAWVVPSGHHEEVVANHLKLIVGENLDDALKSLDDVLFKHLKSEN